LQQLREKGILKPQSETKVEPPSCEEPDVAATTMTAGDDEASKVSSKETQGILKPPQSDAKIETAKDEELDAVTTMTTTGADDETSNVENTKDE
jgi:hypothetical protein